MAAVTATSTQQSTTNAGSSRAHRFFVCLWYEVCRYLHSAAGGESAQLAWRAGRRSGCHQSQGHNEANAVR